MSDATSPTPVIPAEVEDEAIRITRELIGMDTSNYGDGSGPGERQAGEYVVGLMQEVGLDPLYVESEDRRANVVVRVPGADSSRSALVLHGHLDVVPAEASDWTVDPFEGVEQDGLIWGRGAVDMKDMDGMLLANLRHMVREGIVPPRDIVFAFFADEEAGSVHGASNLVENRPELFEGCSEAISEVGGYSITVPTAQGGDQRAYLVQTAEKGILWLNLTAHGRAGHGSVPTEENAIARLARAIAAIDAQVWPREYVASLTGLFEGLSGLTGIPYNAADPSALLEVLGGARKFVEGTLADTAQPSMLRSGYKHNVIPQTATAALDCRFLPGHEDDLMNTLRELVGEHVEVTVHHREIALEAPFEGDLVEAMKQALRAEDPGCAILPYCLSAGTDNKPLARLGINGYGFVPLLLPKALDFAGMFHGVDERVPVDSLRFGTRALARLIRTC